MNDRALIRTASGLAAALAGLYLILVGGLPFFVAAATIGMAGTFEFCRLAARKGLKVYTPLALLGTLALAIASYTGYSEYISIIVLVIIVLSFFVHLIDRGVGNIIAASAANVMSSLYVALPIAFFLQMRGEPHDVSGAFYSLFTIAVVSATDTGAYFVGSTLGKHKLCPAVSPKKTIEGAIGGIVAGFTIGLLLNLILPQFGLHPMSWRHVGPLGLFTAVGGEIGDLIESAIKRDAGVKDSGSFLPGHGGVLDRFDSILIGIIVVYYYMILFL
ncbi:MAG TPA: phosphatidate cytidylyltransferase [Firmicutes bacterium]|nr:phosphatidate cytidylyltransferase [Bacillota bacterium]